MGFVERLAHRVARVWFVYLALGFSASVEAAPWRPLCPEAVSCNYPLGFAASASGPFVGTPLLAPFRFAGQVWLENWQIYPAPASLPRAFRIRPPAASPDSLGAGGDVGTTLSDLNTVRAPDGTILAFHLDGLIRLSPGGEVLETSNWTGRSALALNNAAFLGPALNVNGIIYAGVREAGGNPTIYRSADSGRTWATETSSIPIGESRHHLSSNPEGAGLWTTIDERFRETAAGLWESVDHGRTWTRVDDGSFPRDARRVVIDPVNSLISYAPSSSGLYVSRNRGRTWGPLYLREGVYGLAFVAQAGGRLLVLGTESGVQSSADEGASWQAMAAALPRVPHNVIHADGLLLAVSNAGYFICPGADCLGEPKPLIASPGVGAATEFYNTDLKHYFLTPDPAEAAFIDNGGAGPGWQRTGQSFKIWTMLGNNTGSGASVCRFYGSVSPGPNSHFFTLSPGECGFLIELQERTPASVPRWNLEEFSFVAAPPGPGGVCPSELAPIYRAYNNGFARGQDSNHRFVADRSLLAPLVSEGWIDEGVAFCVPR